MRTSARALLEALSAAGITVRATSATGLFAKPSSAVPAPVIPLLKRFKVELLQALWHRREPSLRACAGCDLDFASGTDALCVGCKLTEFNSVTPNSWQENDYLKRASASDTTVPTVPKHSLRDNRDSVDRESGNHSCAHAHGEKRENSVPTVHCPELGVAA